MKNITKLLLSLFMVAGLSAPVLGSELVEKKENPYPMKKLSQGDARSGITSIAAEVESLEAVSAHSKRGGTKDGRLYVKRRLGEAETSEMWKILTSENPHETWFEYHKQGTPQKARIEFLKDTEVPEIYMNSKGAGKVWLRSVPSVDREDLPKDYVTCFTFVPAEEKASEAENLMFAVQFTQNQDLK